MAEASFAVTTSTVFPVSQNSAAAICARCASPRPNTAAAPSFFISASRSRRYSGCLPRNSMSGCLFIRFPLSGFVGRHEHERSFRRFCLWFFLLWAFVEARLCFLEFTAHNEFHCVRSAAHRGKQKLFFLCIRARRARGIPGSAAHPGVQSPRARAENRRTPIGK